LLSAVRTSPLIVFGANSPNMKPPVFPVAGTGPATVFPEKSSPTGVVHQLDGAVNGVPVAVDDAGSPTSFGPALPVTQSGLVTK
jgi:hypothetical protein